MCIEQAYNYRRVSETISTAGFLKPAQLKALSMAGIDLVMNLMPDDSEYAVTGEKIIVENQGIEYWYLPVDWSAPKTEDFVLFSNKLKLSADKSVLIHCAANYRVSAFYSRYAIQSGQWTVAEADHFMRSVWNPDDYPAWPAWLKEVTDMVT